MADAFGFATFRLRHLRLCRTSSKLLEQLADLSRLPQATGGVGKDLVARRIARSFAIGRLPHAPMPRLHLSFRRWF
jgi:hypothetical protein